MVAAAGSLAYLYNVPKRLDCASISQSQGVCQRAIGHNNDRQTATRVATAVCAYSATRVA